MARELANIYSKQKQMKTLQPLHSSRLYRNIPIRYSLGGQRNLLLYGQFFKPRLYYTRELAYEVLGELGERSSTEFNNTTKPI
jgi:hypothetical protein